MKKYTLILLCLIASFICRAANNTTNYIPIMTPESATLGKFGAFPVSLYTGSIDISIPIHIMRTNNITVPITLQYTGTGFIPNKDCGKVGHDWALIAGGAITRTVNGVPDEWIGGSETFNYDLHGLLGFGSSAPSASSVRNLTFLSPGIPNCETTPDLFSFNFCGHSGQFMIDHSGNVKVVGGHPYKVDISHLKRQSATSATAISKITITDGNGTKYTFGGDINALEINLKKTPSASYIPNGVISAFYLTRIETTNGEYVEFVYSDSKDPYSNFNSAEGHYDGNNIIRNAHYTDYYQNISNMGETDIVYNPAGALGVSYTKGVYLHQIIASAGEKATFVYSSRQIPFCNTTDDNFWEHRVYNNPKLDYIEIKNSDGEIISHTTLYQSYHYSYNYQKNGPDDKIGRMFLDSVMVNHQKYGIEYTSRESLPVPYTRGIDLQGYYNGNDTNTNLLGRISTESAVDFSNRQPSFAHASKGMIKKIIYPTGGNTEFVFENHSYGKAMVIDAASFPTPSLKSVPHTGLVGGLRIKKIINTPGEAVSYEYTTSDGIDSSGVLSDTKRYGVNIDASNPSWIATSLTICSSSNLIAGNTVSEPEIGYSRVEERRGNGNGKKVYHYTTFEDFKDEMLLENSANTLSYTSNATREDVMSTIWITSRHLERGKLTKVEEFSEANALVKETTYEYNNMEGSRANYAIYSCGYRLHAADKRVANAVAHYYYPKHIMSQTVKTLLNGSWHTVKTDYTYSGYNQLVNHETTANSSGDVHLRKIYYTKDCQERTTSAGMIAQNMLNSVLKEEYYCNNELQRTVENEFSAYAGNTSTQYYDLSAVKETNKTGESYYPVKIHSRGRNRNIESITEFGKPVTSYIWGYNNLYPIAKLEGVTATQLNGVSRSNMSHVSQLDELFPDALITRYDYKPQVGMTNCKEPNGLQHYYAYDIYGRLTSIAQENSSSITKKFEYNLLNKPANEQSSGGDDDTTLPEHYVEFTNIVDHVTTDHGCYASTAIIQCDIPVTVTFSVLCEVVSGSQSTTYGCRIGNYLLTQSSQWPEKTFTVELEPGENIIELYVNDLIGTVSIELTIESVDEANVAVGENSYLNLSSDKIN